MKIGFSGTRLGMTPAQKIAFTHLMEGFALLEGESIFSHGDCLGADAFAHGVAKRLCLRIVVRPPDANRNRAFCAAGDYVTVEPPAPYLKRNRAIANWADVVVVAPATKTELPRSGTWATIRHALKTGKRVVVIDPSGTTYWPDADARKKRERRLPS